MKSESYSIKDWPEEERPRERLIKLGVSALSDAHLLSVIIGSGDPATKRNAVDLSLDLIKSFGGVSQIDGASVKELCSIQGIGEAKATQIKAAFELGKRLVSQRAEARLKFGCSQDFVDYYSPFLKNIKKEVVKAALLNPKLRLIKDIAVSEGILNASVVHPREVMVSAIKESAASIVLVHNHPSGDPTPSQADIEITHRLRKTGDIIGIKMIDHIIIGDGTFYSFADEGMI